MKLDVERIFGLENAQIDMRDLINQVYKNKNIEKATTNVNVEITVGNRDDKVPFVCFNF